MTHENFIKFKFQCPYSCLGNHSHAHLSMLAVAASVLQEQSSVVGTKKKSKIITKA